MDVNDNAGCLDTRVVWTTIASKLAPTRPAASLMGAAPIRFQRIRDEQ
jgi:hypothetical protein